MAGVVEAVFLHPVMAELHIQVGALGLGLGGHRLFLSGIFGDSGSGKCHQ